MTDTIRELMNAYDEYRARWISRFGTEDGFNDWFTQQVGL